MSKEIKRIEFKIIKLWLLATMICLTFFSVGCSEADEKEITTEKNNGIEETTTEETTEETTTEKATSVDKLSTVEEIREYLMDKTWYSELDDGSGTDVLFNYSYGTLIFYSDGTAEAKEYRKDRERSESAKWSLTEDKILELYSDDGSVMELVWGDVTPSDTWKWKISEDTLSLKGFDYSIEETKLPEFTDVYVTEHNEIKEHILNNIWWYHRDDALYEFKTDGTLKITEHDKYGNKENHTGYWELSSDNVLIVNIDGAEKNTYKILTQEVCANHKGDFSYYYPYWWMENNGEFRAGDLFTLKKFDKNFKYANYELYERVVNYIKYGANDTFYTDEMISERNNILQTEPYKTILNNELYSYDVEDNIVNIFIDSRTKYQFKVELDDANRIAKITYIDE